MKIASSSISRPTFTCLVDGFSSLSFLVTRVVHPCLWSNRARLSCLRRGRDVCVGIARGRDQGTRVS